MSTAQQTRGTMNVTLEIADLNVISYLSAFDDEVVRCERANEALKVGVIAIRSASPVLDTSIVQAKFTDLEGRMKDFLDEFMTAVRDDLAGYFKEQDGVVPRSINGFFGEDGRLGRTFQTYFDPSAGRLTTLMQQQIGPTSIFGRAIDPKNKDGILTQIERCIETLVQEKLDGVMSQFSLDHEESAMCRMHKLLRDSFTQIHESLGIKAATAAEQERGHVKGFDFEADLYDVFAEMGTRLGDLTENLCGTPGTLRRKTGDYVSTLGDTSGAPGLRLTVEVKNQRLKLKDAIEELQEAKKNRDASQGIFVFAKGCEPPEVGDFRRIGEDFFCTVDKDDLAAGARPLFFDAAYQVARAIAIASARTAEEGGIDLQRIKDNIESLIESTRRLSEVTKKARTIQSRAESISEIIEVVKGELDCRLADVLAVVQVGAPQGR
jgi:hypothetical protein